MFNKQAFLILGFILMIFPIINYNYNFNSKIDIKPIHGQQGTSLLIGTFSEGEGRFKGWDKLEDHKYLKLKNGYFVRQKNNFV